jgi:hypothetical protein
VTLPLQPFPLDETKDLVLERELAVTVAEAWRASNGFVLYPGKLWIARSTYAQVVAFAR